MSRRHSKVTWRVAIRELRHSKGRYLVAGLVIGLVITVATAGDTLYRSNSVSPARQVQYMIGDQADAMVTWFGDGVVSQSPDVMVLQGAQGVVPADLDTRFASAFPGHLSVKLRSEYTVIRSATSLIDYRETLEGNLADPLLDGLYTMWQGVLPQAPGEVMLSRQDAQTLGVGVGDTVEVSVLAATRNFVSAKVVGIHQNSTYGIPVGLAQGTIPDTSFTDDDQPSPVWFLGGGPISWPEVMAGNKHGFVTVSRSVLLNPPPVADVPIYQTDGIEPVDRASTALVTVLVVLAISGVLIALLIGPIFTIGARRSRRDYALLRAQGATAGDILAIMLASSGLVGALVSIGGAALGVGVAAALVALSNATGSTSLPDLQVNWLDLPVIAAAGTVIALVAAWFPARRATRQDLVLALRGQEADGRKQRRLRLLPAVGLAVATIASGATVLIMNNPPWLLLPGLLAVVTLAVFIRPILAGLGRLASHLPLSARVALRDATRRDDRTGPAATVVMAAVATAACVGIIVTTSSVSAAAAWAPPAKSGTLMIMDGEYLAATTDADPPWPASEKRPDQWAQLRAAIEPITPVSQMLDVNTLWINSQDYLKVLVNPDAICPAWADYTQQLNRSNGRPLNQGYPAKADSDNCLGHKADSSGSPQWLMNNADTIVVDDGRLVSALGLPGSDKAAAALAAGKIVVTSPLDLWPDGTAHIGVMMLDQAAIDDWEQQIQASNGMSAPSMPTPTTMATLVADAVLVDWASQTWGVFIPPSLANSATLSPYDPVARRVGVVATTDQVLGSLAFDELRASLAGVGVSTVQQVVPYDGASQQRLVVGVIGAAALFGLIVTWGASRLALADMTPDLRVIYDVGATRRVRRRVAAYTTLAIGLLGSAIGLLAGLLLGLIVDTINAYNGYGHPYVMAIPWLPLGLISGLIPLATAGLAWLLAPQRYRPPHSD